MPKQMREMKALEVGRLAEPGMHTVGGVKGLCLRITATGARAWVMRIMVAGKPRYMGLGGFPDVPLKDAHAKARKVREEVGNGADPILERKRAKAALKAEQAQALTFDQAAQQLVESKGDEWRNPKHRAQWAATLETYASPVIGGLSVGDVTQGHVLKILEPIWRTKTETATRLRGRIEQVLDWAKVRGFREGDNPARWRGHLDKLLPKPSKLQRVQHQRALPIDAMQAFMVSLQARQGVAARALEFAILTAARSGEVRGATWAEIDMASGVWTVPGERMKAGKTHRAPISRQALQLLESMPRIQGSEFVFAAPRGGMLSDMSISAVTRRMEVDAVPHGFRSTFRDWCSERTHYPRDLAEQALAHVLESKVEAAYRRGDALEKRRQMMQEWADFCVCE